MVTSRTSKLQNETYANVPGDYASPIHSRRRLLPQTRLLED